MVAIHGCYTDAMIVIFDIKGKNLIYNVALSLAMSLYNDIVLHCMRVIMCNDIFTIGENALKITLSRCA